MGTSELLSLLSVTLSDVTDDESAHFSGNGEIFQYQGSRTPHKVIAFGEIENEGATERSSVCK